MPAHPSVDKHPISRHHISRMDQWLVVIGALKLVKALLFILLGIGAVRMLHKDLVEVVEHFIIAMRFDPEGRFVNLILEKVALINHHRLREISLAIFAYASLDILEGTGLVLRKTWAEYVTLILTASFLPWEFFEILRHATWIKFGLIATNILVVLYLIFYVQLRARHRLSERRHR
jgi:uncharacterized membrane protein (DUF2068 family)